MKKILYILMTVVALGMPATSEAKKVQVPKMYMFGIAASFSDTIVHFTNVQEIDSAWIEKKNKFLQARQLYSYQLRDYLASEQQMPRRTCIVYAGKNKKKVEEKSRKEIPENAQAIYAIEETASRLRHSLAEQFRLSVQSHWLA